jgi:hypothetical protein
MPRGDFGGSGASQRVWIRGFESEGRRYKRSLGTGQLSSNFAVPDVRARLGRLVLSSRYARQAIHASFEHPGCRARHACPVSCTDPRRQSWKALGLGWATGEAVLLSKRGSSSAYFLSRATGSIRSDREALRLLRDRGERGRSRRGRRSAPDASCHSLDLLLLLPIDISATLGSRWRILRPPLFRAPGLGGDGPDGVRDGCRRFARPPSRPDGRCLAACRT